MNVEERKKREPFLDEYRLYHHPPVWGEWFGDGDYSIDENGDEWCDEDDEDAFVGPWAF